MRRAGSGNTWWLSLRIAGIYALIGLLWILLSDRFVMAVTNSASQRALLQSIKGGVFIVLSSLLIFLLVGTTLQKWAKTRSELELALEQADRLHRILRHNLRNSCQTIAGNAELLAERLADGEEETRIQRIQEQKDRLISLSQKSVFLRDFLEADTDSRAEQELVSTVGDEVTNARETYPEATIFLDCPDHATVYAHQYVGEALEELIENAIIHNDSSNPEVRITVEAEPDEVRVSITDNGPGIPPVEKMVLERKTETKTKHSQGLGLWLVYLTVHFSNGTLTVNDREKGGATVEVTLPRANEGDTSQSSKAPLRTSLNRFEEVL